ncbi:nitrite/sulfite reductase [Acidiferrimicrobium sp. IK]|uniref:nitrite/sulfite reductase n=1 Tax=Acidiferrimicrobium sp. IK TaxID=2871700 RepID=UPI0021CB6F9C|nr:nitrite/sulfite reductase [Acidiferrimicrobium sp. IK]MCU4186277.1 nitrite/sulfite reductase [Acidiferrimicrobium sp. IK]
MHDETCPSVAHVLDRIDGGLARVRFPGGRVPAAQLRAVADAASRFGNGTIEITNRANLQLRGVRPEAGADLAAALMAAGASHGREGDLRRNVVSGPLAGLDPTEIADTRPLVAAIVARLAGDPSLDALSPKAGVVVDGGGRWHLGGRRDDVVVTALTAERFAIRAGAGLPAGGVTVAAGRVPGAVHQALLATVGTRDGGGRRLADAPLPPGSHEAVTVGPLGTGPAWVGGMPPLGRMSAATAEAVARIAERWGDGEVRLTPWRGVVLGGAGLDGSGGAREVAGELGRAGLLVDPSDPLTALVACAGSHGCTSGLTDAPADALAVAFARRAEGAPPLQIHVSGCPKRCAQQAPAAVTLAATAAGAYEVWRAGTLVGSGVAPGDAVAMAAGGAQR